MNLSLILIILWNYLVFSFFLLWKDVNFILYYYIMDYKLKIISLIIWKKDFKIFYIFDDWFIFLIYKIFVIYENVLKYIIVIVIY